MKKVKPYKDAVKALLAKVVADRKAIYDQAKRERYAFYISVFRENDRWSEIQQKMVPYPRRFYVKNGTTYDSGYAAYNYWTIKLTTDFTEKRLFTAEEAVMLSGNLPFENQIGWCADHRDFCTDCKAPFEYDTVDGKWAKFCVKCRKPCAKA